MSGTAAFDILKSKSAGTEADVADVVEAVGKTAQQRANEVTPLILPSVYMTYGGTADAVTLTSPGGAHLTSLVTGMQFRFRATAANTGAMTIAVDGLSAVTVKTITGVDTPADYIRTDVTTVVEYDGTHFIADRQVERGSNYTRWADGTQECRGQAISDTGGEVITLPAAFVNDEYRVTTAVSVEFNRTSATYNKTTISFTHQTFVADTGAESSTSADYIASGHWY